MIEKKCVVGAFQCNCRLWACERTGEAILIDPGDEAAKILSLCQNTKTPSGSPISLKYLLHTHGHLDHIGATRELMEFYEDSEKKPKIALHRADEALYLKLKEQGHLFGIDYLEPFPVDHFLQEDEALKIGDLKLSILHTPGHSPGSICIRLHEDSDAGSQETLLSGDTLFQGSVGRTDLWGGNAETMFKNIREKILTLDGSTRVCPGHGPDTRIEVEKRTNPFLI